MSETNISAAFAQEHGSMSAVNTSYPRTTDDLNRRLAALMGGEMTRSHVVCVALTLTVHVIDHISPRPKPMSQEDLEKLREKLEQRMSNASKASGEVVRIWPEEQASERKKLHFGILKDPNQRQMVIDDMGSPKGDVNIFMSTLTDQEGEKDKFFALRLNDDSKAELVDVHKALRGGGGNYSGRISFPPLRDVRDAVSFATRLFFLSMVASLFGLAVGVGTKEQMAHIFDMDIDHANPVDLINTQLLYIKLIAALAQTPQE